MAYQDGTSGIASTVVQKSLKLFFLLLVTGNWLLAADYNLETEISNCD
jgi:hypothetical protein